jgi:hypothetical protein
MDDEDFNPHIEAESKFRNKEKKAKEGEAAVPPWLNKVVSSGGEYAQKVGDIALSALNPIHANSEGIVDWPKTVAHGLVEAPVIAYGAGKLAGVVKSGYNSSVGVDPTIAAQNEVSREKIALEKEKMNRVQASKAAKAAPVAAPPVVAPVPKAEIPKSVKPLDPIDQQLLNKFNEQQAAKQNVPAVPPAGYTGNVVKPGAEANIAHNEQQILGNKAAQAAGGGYSRAPGSIVLVPDQYISAPPSPEVVPNPNQPQPVPQSQNPNIQSQRGGVNVPAVAEVAGKIPGAIAATSGQVAQNIKAGLPMIPFGIATDIQGQNRGYRRELEQQLKTERNANRAAELQAEIQKLDENKYLNSIKRRYIDRNIPAQLRPQ